MTFFAQLVEVFSFKNTDFNQVPDDMALCLDEVAATLECDWQVLQHTFEPVEEWVIQPHLFKVEGPSGDFVSCFRDNVLLLLSLHEVFNYGVEIDEMKEVPSYRLRISKK